MTTRQNVPSDFGEGGRGITPGGSSTPATPSGSFGSPTLPRDPDLASILWALLARVAPACASYAALTAFGASNALDRQHNQVVLVGADSKLYRWDSASTAAASAGRVYLADDLPSAGRWVVVGSDAAIPGMVSVNMRGAVLAAGTPLAAYAGSTPGLTLNSSKSVGVRWKGGTLTTVWTEVDLPLDLDPTFPVLANLLVSKSGATAADVTGFTLAAYAQTVGALEDAGANLGAASTALTTPQASLAAGTVTRLQVPIYLPPTAPARLSISLTPVSLATDDATLEGFWLEYTPRPAVPRTVIDLKGAVLAAGTPLAAWADNAGASAPGITLDNAKAVGVRWNNQATLTAVWSSFVLPADMDVTKPSLVVALVSKSGATAGDTMTLDVGLYEQVAGALEDATTNLGGTTTAIAAPTATAKTVAKVTLGLPPNTFTAGPHPVTVSVKPTDTKLGTDDGVVEGFWLEYTKKPAVKVAAVDFRAAILAAGTPLAAFANNAGASAPGVTLNNSKAVGVRWNNFTTFVQVWADRPVPLDFDVNQPATLVLSVSKSGATLADTGTFDVAVWEQVPGSLETAGPSLLGTTTAVSSPTAAAKTVSRLTLNVPAGTFTAAPGRLSVSVKPTDGKLGIDDALLAGAWFEYSPRAA